MNNNMQEIMQTIFQIAVDNHLEIPRDILEKIIQIQFEYSEDHATALKKISEVIDSFDSDEGGL